MRLMDHETTLTPATALPWQGHRRGRVSHQSCTAQGFPSASSGSRGLSGVGEALDALGDHRLGGAGPSFLRRPPPLHAPFDQDCAPLAERGLDHGRLAPERQHLDTADVLVPGVPLAQSGRHGKTPPGHRRAVRGRPHRGILDHIAEEVHTMQRGHRVVSCKASPRGDVRRGYRSNGVPARLYGPSHGRYRRLCLVASHGSSARVPGLTQ